MEKINSTEILGFEDFSKNLTRLKICEETYDTGGIILGTDSENVYVDSTDSHSIIFGATGSKKTRMLIMPTIEVLKKAGESFVVTDPKGEIYQKTGGNLEELGYNTLVINFRDFNKGSTWNPLLLAYDNYHSGHEAKAIEMAGVIAEMIMGDMDKTDPYWTGMAKDVILGFIVLLIDTTARQECHLKNLIRLWEIYQKDRIKFNKKIREDYGASFIGMKLSGLDNSSERTVGSIEAVAIGGINKLTMNEDFIQFLSHSDAGIESIHEGKRAVYIIVPDENKYYHMAASILIGQIYEVLIKEAQKKEEKKLGCRMNFVIDEFTNLPTISNMESMITASRSRNIRFMLAVQSMSQLQEKYKEAQIIVSNCNNWIYLYSKEYTLLTQISQLCGNVVYDNGITLPLLSEFDLQHLDKELGEALVLSGRNNPCIVNYLDIDEYPYKNEAEEIECQEVGAVEVITSERFYTSVASKNKEAYGLNTGKIWEYRKAARTDTVLNHNEIPIYDDLFSDWIAAAYKDQIVASRLCSSYSIADKMIFVADLINEYGLENLKRLTWYRGRHTTERKAKNIMEANPEKVYLTTGDFTMISSKILNEIPSPLLEIGVLTKDELENIKPVKTSNWKARLIETGAKSNTVLSEYEMTEVEEIKLGLETLVNSCFRKANEELKGTQFERCRWKMDKAYSSADLFCFRKSISSSKYITLWIEKISE